MLVSSYLLETDSKPIQPETKFIFPFLAEPLFLQPCVVHCPSHLSLESLPSALLLLLRFRRIVPNA